MLPYLLLNGLIEKHLKLTRVVFNLLYYKESLSTSADQPLRRASSTPKLSVSEKLGVLRIFKGREVWFLADELVTLIL